VLAVGEEVAGRLHGAQFRRGRTPACPIALATLAARPELHTLPGNLCRFNRNKNDKKLPFEYN
jgi:hypothetical protein